MKDQQILNWIKTNKVRTNKGTRIEFNDHHFLLDYLLNNSNRIVIQKAAQVGASFTTILKILYRGGNKSLTTIYTLPTASDARDFVHSKFDPIIERSEGLRYQVRRAAFKDKPLWSGALKKIGGSYYFFRGSWVAWKAQSIDADVLVVDELDFQKPEIRSMYEERLEGSNSEDVIYWIGYPSIPNYGIADIYQKSDQREWWIKCPHCGRWQRLTWPDSISRQKKTYVCKYCRKDLSNEDRKRGKWVAKYPGRPIHGYHINKLMAPWIPATRILKAFRDDTPKHFYNYTLGLPYVDSKSQVSDEVLKGATIDSNLWNKLKSDHVICGIDQGDHFQFVAGTASPEAAVIMDSEIFSDPKDLEARLDYYNPDIIVIDMLPDKHIAKLLQEKYGINRFFLGNLRNWGDSSTVRAHYEVKRGTGIVNIERTESLDFLIQSITDGYLKFRDSTPYLQTIFRHLKNLVPDYQERFGKVRKVWKKVGKDDYAHALNFFLVGCQILFPKREIANSEIVPVAVDKISYPGSREWIKEDFEKTVRKLANPDGVIIIPPKR